MKRLMPIWIFVPLLLAIASATNIAAVDWPQWRGPDGQGHATARNLPTTWSGDQNVSWKTEVPGRGWSSPVIEGKTVWMTTGIETPATKEDVERRLKANTGDQPLTLLEKVELRAIGVDRDTGKLTHDILLLTVREPQWVHQLNSYASPSPVVEDGKLYAHFGALGTVCADLRAEKVLWANTSLVVMHENGPGGSPVVWKNLVIFQLDGSDQQFAVALDKRTGKLVWKTPRSGEMNKNPQLRKSYGTPLLLNADGSPMLLSPASDWVYGLEPATGKELWKVPYGQLGFSLTPRPVVGHGMVFMATGFGKKQMLAIRVSKSAPEIVWRYNKGIPTMPSPLLAGDELYFVDDGGFLTCLDAKTGAEHYRERLGGNYSSSPTFADGKIYISNREGLTTVVKPGRKFEALAKNELPGKIFASLAVADNVLFLRTDTALYRLEESKSKRPGAQ